MFKILRRGTNIPAMKNKILFSLLVLSLFPLAACSGTKEKLGLVKKPPDEFAVVKRAPLAMPPNYGLRPPNPGAPRPQEQATNEQAKEAVFGSETPAMAANPSDPESMLLQEAGGGSADPNIRQKVDVETANMKDENKPVVKKLLGFAGGKDEPPATVVDPKKESERLRKNSEEGKPVTEGETPSVKE